MAAEWIGNLISGIAGVGAAGINYASQQAANETNIQLARENRDFYYQQWLRENAYNDPSAQMARLSRAGLNPALMYGEGAGGLPASASMSAVDAARVSAPQVDPFLLAQIANINADTEQKKADTQSTLDENARQNELQPFNVQNVQANNRVLEQTVKTMSAQEQEAYSRAALADCDRDIKNSTAEALLRSMNADAKMKEAVADFNLEQTKQLVALYDLRKQGIVLSHQEIISRIGVNEAEARRLEKALDVMESEIELNHASSQMAPLNTLANIGQSIASVRNSKVAERNVSVAEARLPYQNELDQASAQFQRSNAQYLYGQTKYPGIFGQAIQSGKSFGKAVIRHMPWNW